MAAGPNDGFGTDHLAAAQAALDAGRPGEAITHFQAAVDADPDRPLAVYRALAMLLFRAGRTAEGADYSAIGVRRHPGDYELTNAHGVFLRRLGRTAEAVRAFEAAIALDSAKASARRNLGNALLDAGDGARAEAVLSGLAAETPNDPELRRLLGRALRAGGRTEDAVAAFRAAVGLKPDRADAWLDLIATLNEAGPAAAAEAACDEALAAIPGHAGLLKAKGVVLRGSGNLARAQAYLTDLLPRHGGEAWLHYQLGTIADDPDRTDANAHFRRAVALAPDELDYSMALIESVGRTTSGDEGANIDEAHALCLALMDRAATFDAAHLKIAMEALVRVCDFEALDRLGDVRTLGRALAAGGRHTALLKQIARVRDHADRLELLEQHRIWGRRVQAEADRHPIRRPAPRPPGGKIRLGFMSSDLRGHPVGYFALPLFDHVDRERFEVFVYSFYRGPPDALQARFAAQATAYHQWPRIGAREAAQRIADDDLDMLIELGGSTHMNKLEVMAYRPAPRQASWLGYPHSAGLETIDYLICDPWTKPDDEALLIETPLVAPRTWIALGEAVFSDDIAPAESLPEQRNGFITYGTANDPHKYTPEGLRAWAQVVAQTPGSRFAFLRPEAGSAVFRRNIEAAFAAEGVTADRLRWMAVRGRHMPLYDEIDITLDPFPLTGGTTTAEALWMGVPVVSLRGEAFFERLSWSILSNAGLGDLCAADLDGYRRIALALAADAPRRLDLKRTLRRRIKSSPLGQTEAFARDIYDLVRRAVRGG